VYRRFYGVHALEGADLIVRPGTITGLIGPNGAGKTTLFNCISGMIPPERGSIRFDGHEIGGLPPHRITALGLIRTFQIARGFPRLTVLENLLLYGAHQPGEKLWTAIGGGGRGRERVLLERAFAVAERLNLGHVANNPARRGKSVQHIHDAAGRQ
jgi:ABC-type branched-subunit amino acid transport system ATPase component